MTWCGRSDPEHRVRTCNPCRAAYQRRLRKIGRMSPPSRKEKGGWQPSPLNRRVDRKYAACQERGGCVPSGQWIERNGSYVPTCRHCSVPMMKLASGSPWRTWTGDAA